MLQLEEAMQADRIDVSWDQAKSNWLVRITSGEEVIRRHCDGAKNADDQTLRTAALKTAQDEGYDAATVSIQR